MERVDANGISTSFMRRGKGPPLLLVHGAEADHSMFDAFVPQLTDDFTVIAYDQRDSGSTTNPPAAYGFGELADDLAALIAALGYERAHVFATSFGGAIAQAAASRHPERIDRLVLSSTFKPGSPMSDVNPDFPRFAEIRSRLPDSVQEFATYFFTPDYLADHPEAVSVFTGGNARTEEQKQRRGGVIPRPVSVDLGAITAPTLVLVGEHDRLIPPPHTLSLAREIAGARTTTIKGVGHVGTRQNPAAVAAEVKAFLQENSAQQRKISEETGDAGPRGGSR